MPSERSRVSKPTRRSRSTRNSGRKQYDTAHLTPCGGLYFSIGLDGAEQNQVLMGRSLPRDSLQPSIPVHRQFGGSFCNMVHTLLHRSLPARSVRVLGEGSHPITMASAS